MKAELQERIAPTETGQPFEFNTKKVKSQATAGTPDIDFKELIMNSNQQIREKQAKNKFKLY